MIVLALSNWDRFEVPYDNYGKEKLGLYEKTKNYKPLPILDDDFYSFYKKHHLKNSHSTALLLASTILITPGNQWFLPVSQ